MATADRRRGDDEYLKLMRSRLRSLDLEVRLRNIGIQVLWLVVVVAGAAVPLVVALDWPAWISPVLGFVVVVAAGIERIFSRTTEAAVAVDELRRNLARERRLLLAGSGDYADEARRFGVYVTRTEDAIARFDRRMLAYSEAVVRSAEGDQGKVSRQDPAS